MAALTDHQLIEQIQLGQGEALGQLFDRYGAGVFDFLSRVVGDPDEAVHLVVDIFARFPKAAVGIPEHESVRGTLFSLAREMALSYLRQHGWLDSLPRLAPASISTTDLATDIWQTARAIPASQRAVLSIAEHQVLSPTEQATALGITRHALADVVAEARRSFNKQFDLRAQAQGKPTFALINADQVPGLQRRIHDLSASLFTFLPVVALPDPAQMRVRNQIVAAPQPEPVHAAAPTPAPVQPPPLAPLGQDMSRGGQRDLVPMLIGLGMIAVLLIVILTVLAINGAQQTATPDTIPPVIKRIEPPDGAILPPGKRVVVQVVYDDDRGVDVNTVRLILDGKNVTLESTVSATFISYAADLGPGQHVVLVELKDTAGNSANRTWQFAVTSSTATPTATALSTATGVPTATSLPTATRLPTATPLPSVTAIPAPALPDLVVTDISLSPNAEILYTIRNNGRGDVTQPFLIRVLVDGVVVDSNRKVSSLGAGQEASLFVPNYRLSGTHAVTVNVNADHAIQESNYANGELTRTLSGPIPTPTPSPTLSPAPSPSPTPK